MPTTTTDHAAPFRAALAPILPADVSWSVRVNPRRKRSGAWVEPGQPGGPAAVIVVAVAPTADPATVARHVRAGLGRLLVAVSDMSERGARIVRKQLVNGEGFPFAGTNHRLRLVVDGDDAPDRTPAGALTRHPGVPIIAEAGPSTWSGIRTHQLTMRRDAASAARVIGWYRSHGQAWLDRTMPELLRRLHVPADAWPTWTVRPYVPSKGYGGSWGTYRNPPHAVYVDWFAFQLPADRLRHIAAHEAAHAAIRGASGHGAEWQLLMGRLCPPDWRDTERRVKAAEGHALWLGELKPDGAPVAPVEPAPFVSRWALAAGAR